MASLKFTVKIDGAVVAEHMDLETACILLEAVFQKYFETANAGGMEVTIVSEPLDLKVTL